MQQLAYSWFLLGKLVIGFGSKMLAVDGSPTADKIAPVPCQNEMGSGRARISCGEWSVSG